MNPLQSLTRNLSATLLPLKPLRRRLLALAGAAALGLAPQAPVLAQSAPRVALVTSAGTIVVELNPAKAPVSVENFLNYVKKGHYNGTIFHRVIDSFMIQGGGFESNLKERKPSSPPILNEATNGLKNLRGTIAMARTSVVNSATAQFFINTVDNEFLDHIAVPPEGITVNRGGRPTFIDAGQANAVFGYAVFGKVVEGMDVVDKIRKTETRPAGANFRDLPTTPIVIEKATVLNPK